VELGESTFDHYGEAAHGLPADLKEATHHRPIDGGSLAGKARASMSIPLSAPAWRGILSILNWSHIEPSAAMLWRMASKP